MTSKPLICTALITFLMATSQITHANDYTAQDKRITIPVTAEERSEVLFEMRELLHALFAINIALSHNDFATVVVEATPTGPLLDRFPDSLKRRLPREFLQLGNGLHHSFNALVKNAQDHHDLSLTLRDESEILTYCSGCHDQFRFEPRTSDKRK
jgi:hypothetical protein